MQADKHTRFNKPPRSNFKIAAILVGEKLSDDVRFGTFETLVYYP